MDFDLDPLTEQELLDLNRRVVARIESLREVRLRSAMLKLRIGDLVLFERDDEEPVVGTVIRFNRKTVTVLTDERVRWNVTPTLLEKLT